MANKVRGFIALTGGGVGALDAIDGDLLSDNDMAVGIVNGVSYQYQLNASSGAAEDSPQIISPNTNAGTKRWEMTPSGCKFSTLADDATPSVAFNDRWLTGGTTTITDFDDGIEGQIIRIISEHSITITDGTNIFLSGSANFVMSATDTLTLVCKPDNKWYELGRSDNT